MRSRRNAGFGDSLGKRRLLLRKDAESDELELLRGTFEDAAPNVIIPERAQCEVRSVTSYVETKRLVETCRLGHIRHAEGKLLHRMHRYYAGAAHRQRLLIVSHCSSDCRRPTRPVTCSNKLVTF